MIGHRPHPAAPRTRARRPRRYPRRDGRTSREGRGDRARTRRPDRFDVLYRDVLHLDKYAHLRGTRIIKCPLDLWIYQELVFELEPDLIVETGTMDGGSALYFASLLDLLGTGEVVSVDKVDRPGRPSHPRIDYVLGSSVDEDVLAEVRARAERARTVLVALDSGHTADHVHAELHAYGPLVTPGSYMIVEDTNINGHPVEPTFGPGPMEAVHAFLGETTEFELDRDREKFLLTFNPSGFLRRTGG